MKFTNKRNIFLFFIALFSLTVISSQFFHQETTLQDNQQCTICQWQKDTVSLAKIYILSVLITFVLFYNLSISNEKNIFFFLFYHFSNRAPPKNQ